jgi:hypothetical protein
MQVTTEQLLSFLPQNREEYEVIANDQNVPDIIGLMLGSYAEFGKYYDKIWQFFEGPTVRDTCDNLFQFCRDNLAYDEETVKWQSVAPPFGILDRGHCDCKGYAGFIGGCLGAMSRATGEPIDWCFCFASYDAGQPVPYHVFVIVKDAGEQIWVDPTPGSEYEDPKYMLCQKPGSIGGVRSRAVVDNTGQLHYGAIGDVTPAATTTPTAGSTGNPAVDEINNFVNSLPPSAFKTHLQASLGGALPVIEKWIKGYKYTDGDYALGEIFQNRVLNQATTNRWATPDAVIPIAWMYFTTLFGIPIAVNTDFDTIESGSLSQYLAGRTNQAGFVTQAQVTRAKQLLDGFGNLDNKMGQWPPSAYGLIPYVAPIPDARIAGALFTGVLPNGQQVVNGYPTTEATAGTDAQVPGSTSAGLPSLAALWAGNGKYLIIGAAALLVWFMVDE